MNVGIWQVILILIVVLIVFGAGKLPKVMGDLGKGIQSFKRGMLDENSDNSVDINRIGQNVINKKGNSKKTFHTKEN